MRAVREYRLSFWDALLWATVRRAGIAVLVSEDFQDGRVIEGVRFVNPFVPENAGAIAAALEF
jgi:predicted nucleic acid-binding protein